MSTDLKITDELTKAIQASQNPADMTAAVQAELQKQETAAVEAAAVQAAADKVVADKAAADAAAVAITGFSRTEIIGGKEFTFDAASELELERMVNNAFKVAYAVQNTEVEPEPVVVVDPAAAQKAAEEAVVAKAELETKFKRGDISTAEYLEQSGAVDEYLAKKGIPLDALRDAVNRNQNTEFEQSWADATEAFKNGPAGADWPGGERNREIIGLKLAAMGLVDAKDKVAALAQAYASMKATGMVFAADATSSSTVVADQAAASKSAAEKLVVDAAAAEAARVASLAAATTAKTAATSSGMFGRSSGVGGATSIVTPAAAKIDIPNDATPAEILDAWKKEQVRQGKDPNAAFFDTFSTRRA